VLRLISVQTYKESPLLMKFYLWVVI